MPEEPSHPLRVFLCHASGDKPQVRALYKRLVAEGVDAWLDQEKLLPGQDWRVEIPRAVRESDVVVICLSNKSITKEGYIQKEIKFALDVAEEKPEGSIFLIPARLEDCPVPDQMSRWQWVDLYEENGFMKLLRSLKLRADKVGAVIEPSSRAEDDQEIERRLNQLYTEGLAAFYTEDWDRACRRFQTILNERPNHKGAIEKLEEAERQRDLAKLYLQATEAYQAEDWELAIKSLEVVFGKSTDYKDTSQLLKNAKKHKQLMERYAEAKALHAAQKWQAVLKVFDQISAIDSMYQDPDGLLSSAQKEMTELKRLAELNDLYTNAIHEMDASRWYEARKLLEQLHKSQIGFLDTERLLKKVESEITRLEEQRKRSAQVQMLYEHARKMAKAGQWGKALEQMEEIQKLDNQFVDSDGILEKSKAELGREEQETKQRRELASLYAEAVSLLDAKKYQEALEKWNTIQAIDPLYKDTSRIRVTARRKLDELSRPEKTESPWSLLSRIKPAQITVEVWLFLAVVSIAVIHAVWQAIVDWSHPFDTTIGGVVFLFLLFGLYGFMVTIVYKKGITAWSKQSSWILIIGWALGGGVALIAGIYFGLFRPVFMIIVALSSALAMKWAKAPIGSITIVFISWPLAWWAGFRVNEYLDSILEVTIVGAIGDTLAILLGLLFTLGAQLEDIGKLLRTAFWGTLGFALGSFIVDLPILSSLSLPAEFYFSLWGVIGGAVLEASSRNPRRIISSAVTCGLGLLAGSFVAYRILPVVLGKTFMDTFPGIYSILLQICYGAGLGLALGLPTRRASAIGIWALLGAGIYMTTRALNEGVFNFSDFWENILRGALIGLVLGYGYGYMRGANPSTIKVESKE